MCVCDYVRVIKSHTHNNRMHTQGTQQRTPLRPFGKRSWLLDLHVKLHRKDSQSCARRSGAMVTICQHRHAAQKRSELQVTHQILEETCGVFCNCMPCIYRERERKIDIYIYIQYIVLFNMFSYVFHLNAMAWAQKRLAPRSSTPSV